MSCTVTIKCVTTLNKEDIENMYIQRKKWEVLHKFDGTVENIQKDVSIVILLCLFCSTPASEHSGKQVKATTI